MNKKVKSKIFHYDFFSKNRKGVMSMFLKIVLWIVIFSLVFGAASYAWGG